MNGLVSEIQAKVEFKTVFLMFLTIFQSCEETGMVFYLNVKRNLKKKTADISVCQKFDYYDM